MLWKWFAGNCHVTRRTAASMTAAGFRIERLQHERMAKALPWVRPTILGVARTPLA